MKYFRPIKLRNKFSQTEIYYTHPTWPQKQIDGVDFIPVSKMLPSTTEIKPTHYMRKDSLEKVK